MPTATADKSTAKVVFGSRSPNQVLTRRAERKVPDGFGGVRIENQQTYLAEMRAKNEERERLGVELLEVDESPWKVQFTDHRYETDDPVIIEWLRGHDNFGLVNSPSGFYEEPPIVDPVKEMAGAMGKIIEAQSIPNELDRIAALVAIRDAEANGSNRPEVIEVAEAAIRAASEESSESEADADTGNGDSPSTSKPSPTD